MAAHVQPRLFFFFLVLHPLANSISFNYSTFNGHERINFKSNASQAEEVINLTRNQIKNHTAVSSNIGWATYKDPVPIYDKATRKLADFTTHFSFIIQGYNATDFGDGLAFFLAPFGSDIPKHSAGGYLGIFNDTSNLSKGYRTVAVEFDTHQNDWDPSEFHMGINIGSIESDVTTILTSSIKDGSTANARVSYNANTMNLSVFLTYGNNESTLLHKIVNLMDVLPDTVVVGFSAATGLEAETHVILSWEFHSSQLGGTSNSRIGVIIGSVVCACVVVFVAVLGGTSFLVWKYKIQKKRSTGDDVDMSIEFANGTGPKRFSYRELRSATNGFDNAGKLGEGGFGEVYKGVLRDSSGTEVAIKRVSKESKQGRKEYAAEVNIISRLRHRNLVQLIGWCHDRGELLLVYELMPNGSLDSHLFGTKNPPLQWETRYKIALGVASSLLYLHEEWEQCVVHRDIKSSNIMLDSGFNAKLGDFGLARLVDHGRTSQTTVPAGTMGYLAPECVVTRKASKESDVYSFGVVALEIACGRKPVEPMLPEEKVMLVEYVWELYGRRETFEAADERLDKDFDEAQMDRLMVVGLWCVHPDHKLRPTIRQAINVLSFEAALPVLPSKMPVPTYCAPPMLQLNVVCNVFVGGTSSGTTNSSIQTVPAIDM